MATMTIESLPENPSELSTELSRLFPAGVIAAEVTEPVSRAVLAPAELRFIAHCADKRIQDFSAGRACARRALAELGITDFAVLSGEQREPLWPEAVVGSITHTHGYAAAVVARQSELPGVGVDCEVVASVNEGVWPHICVPSEVERLRTLIGQERQRQAALTFAAKEAFYKCQFPLTRAWVGFEEVAIERLGGPAEEGVFRIVPQHPLTLPAAVIERLVCRFQFRGPWVMAGVSAAT
jgi:4'-phosphopantetheinyl transferase EntD